MLLDSFSWIEFFNGTWRGKRVEKILNEETCYTSLISLAEISEFCSKANQNFNIFFETIKTLSVILSLDQRICVLAGKINFHRKKIIKDWGMVDSIILVTALLNNLKILTGDKHFSDLENVEML